jgi:VRR-NUC domain.
LQALASEGIFAFKVMSASVRGVADVCAMYQGKVFFIEVKNDKGKLSPHQEAFASKCRMNSVQYIVCRGKDDIEEIIKNIKICNYTSIK